MGTPYDSIGSYSQPNWDSILNNQFYQIAANSPNINFKAASESSSQGVDSTQTAQYLMNNGTNSVISQPAAQKSSGGISLSEGVLGAALLAGGTYLLLRGHKNGLFNKVCESIKGKFGGESTSGLKKLAVIKNGSGEYKIQVPGKTVTFTGSEITTKINEYGIQDAVSPLRKAFNHENSVLDGFIYETKKGNKYTIFIKDGKITKIKDKSGNDVLKKFTDAKAESSESKLLEKFNNIAEEIGKDPKEIEKALLNGVSDIRYTNTFGDDVLKLTMGKYEDTPVLKSFTTLEQFDKNCQAVKEYIPSGSEELFVGEIFNKTGSWFNKKGVLVDGLCVLKCEKEIGGATCYFEAGELVKIVQGGESYAADSFGFKEFVKANSKKINEFTKAVFEDRKADQIPQGSIIGLV